MTNKRMILGLVAIIAITTAVFMSGSSNTAAAKKAPPVSFEFSVTYSPERGHTLPTANEITEAVLAAGRIGSSGEDGVLSDFQVDSFFDVEYRLFGDPDSLFAATATIDIELVALSLTGASPIPVIDNVGDALGKLPGMTEYRGHVTVLK